MEERDRHPRFSFGADPNAPLARARTHSRKLRVLAAVLALTGATAAYLYVFEPETVRTALKNTPLALTPAVTQAYKWQDAEGGWNITSHRPPEGVTYETISVRSDANIIPAFPTSEKN